MSYSQTYYARMIRAIQGLDLQEVERAVDLIEDAWRGDQQIFTLGNGGSGSTASHFISDWNKGIPARDGRRLRGICLNDNVPMMMAYANDVSYESIFEEPLKNLMRPGDLVIGISGSGNSRNVLRAITYANEHGGRTLGLCGYDGGRLKELAQQVLHVREHHMQLVEDLHLSFGHIVMGRLCGDPRQT
ncbi:SIS domain-containing protein [Archangium violaceum]|uniref:SIS domain-containing protein n=1 Tax=Archangium violaceum TaxID=83451 RepID=UPI00194F8776|nr:SIS domain-containing protein [Archangium violaceum]QRN99077.1 SIS domain-containing protein [Archangium violaceum]